MSNVFLIILFLVVVIAVPQAFGQSSEDTFIRTCDIEQYRYVENCVVEQHKDFVRNHTETWITSAGYPNSEGLYNNLKVAREILKDSGNANLVKFVSDKNINALIARDGDSSNKPDTLLPINELKSILSSGIESRVIAVMEQAQKNIIDDSRLSVDEKTDMVFFMIEWEENMVSYQKGKVNSWVDAIYSSIYVPYLQYQSDLDRKQAELENEIRIIKEKDAIRQEILSQTQSQVISDSDSIPICGSGTVEKNGQCVVDSSNKSNTGGGCLIATATYGTELVPQVQQLRELRDNSLLQTKSGSAFIESFNSVYYSFSPYIADYERENPVFKEIVKIAITPMISSLSILNYVDMDSEAEVLGYGISLILLNLGMYVGIPASVIVRIRKNKMIS